MKSGIVSLQPLYKFLRSNHGEADYDGRSPKGRRYAAAAATICQTIAPTQGFYLWGRYESNGLWRNIYLGKAGFGKTAHLRARILEELKDERACIWCAFVSVDTLEAAAARIYSKMWYLYKSQMQRALKKSASTHIVWVSDPELGNAEVQNIESDLIETLSPRANVSRPVPPLTLQQHTKVVIAEFRALIHAQRQERFFVKNRRVV